MINSHIVGRGIRNKADVHEDGFLKVDARPHYIYRPTALYLTNPINGNNMAVNGSATDISTNVYDGNDNTYWTWSIISGVAGDFVESTDQNHTPGGQYSLDFSASEDSDTTQFAYPGGNFSLSGYTVLTGWIYLTSWADLTKNIFIYGWDLTSDSMLGLSVSLSDYINIANLNVWQSYTISLSDMGLTGQTIDAIRYEIEDDGPGGAPDGYLDDISFAGSATGGPFEYTIAPSIGQSLRIHTLTYSLAQDYDNTLANATMPNLDWNKLLNVTLNSGLLYRRYAFESIQFSANWTTLLDIVASPGTTMDMYGSTGSSVFLTFSYHFAVPADLAYSRRDKISIQVSDNLSALSFFRINANCSIESEV